ncbi:MAG: UvrB/UvrC motif-containing protein [Candidatus Moranbacteria bacterium]|nr:UvrB/UvrC motif-containing protein [Candidatus Moranbacteria bacterium]
MFLLMSFPWKKKILLATFRKKNTLPETPGVYFFLGAKQEVLYIGKATVLRDRVRSYFSADIMETRGPKIARMLEGVRAIGYHETDSVIEALILETSLIKKYQPPYNTDAKDDKSYNHVIITKEKFPRILIVRGRDIEQKKFTDPVKYIFGPFPHGTQLREAMKIIRKIFPYRDKCVPNSKKCFSAQIGLCPGVCVGEVSARDYGQTVTHIRLFFEGHKIAIIKKLQREMREAAKKLDFERAGEIKKTVFALEHIQDVALIKGQDQEVTEEKRWGVRIEAFDVAHLQGEASVGVMTVVENGKENKEEYRKFRLRENHRGNDLSALEEIVRRRLTHTRWRMPDIVVTDGAWLQRQVAEKLFSQSGTLPLLVGVVKDKHHRPKDIIGLPVELAHFRESIMLANSEAHRFAIAYHRHRRDKEFLTAR